MARNAAAKRWVVDTICCKSLDDRLSSLMSTRAYHAGIYKCIFVLNVTRDELLPQKGGILEVLIKSDVQDELGRKMSKLDGL